MSREYCDYVLDLLRPRLSVVARAMFGGYGLYVSGLMFGLIFEDTLYLKTAARNRPDFEAAGAAPFCYSARGKTVTMSYREAPAELFDAPEALQDWAIKACRAAEETRKPRKIKAKKTSLKKRPKAQQRKRRK